MSDNNKYEDLPISSGIKLKSVSDYIKTENTSIKNDPIDYEELIKSAKENPEINSSYSTHFKDLSETDTPEIIDTINNRSVSRIDNIRWSDFENYDKEIIESIVKIRSADKTGSVQTSGSSPIPPPADKIEPPSVETAPVTSVADAPAEIQSVEEPVFETPAAAAEELSEPIDEIEAAEIEDADVLSDEVDDVSFLSENINRSSGTVRDPGKFDFETIDETLKKKDAFYQVSTVGEETVKDELFGVNKTEIYYTIDKQIYGKRARQKLNLSSIKNISSGIILPIVISVVFAGALLVASPFMSYYFKKISVSPLEDNIKNDMSILNKIAKQKEDEAKLLKKQLEDELRRLDSEKNMIQATINEELLKKQIEIENSFKKRVEELDSQRLSRDEVDRLTRQLEADKDKALSIALSERDDKLKSQEDILDMRNKELEEAKNQISQSLANKEFEINSVKEALNEQMKQKDSEREAITRKLEEIRTYNERVSLFNERIFKMISSGMEEFKNNNNAAGLSIFSNVIKYYESEKTFAYSDPALKNKMITDLFFIETISGLVEQSKNSYLYDKDFLKVLNQFKTINSYYTQAESYYASRDFSKALGEYSRVLGEFDVVQKSYEKMQLIEREIQNGSALNTFNEAMDSLKSNDVGRTITLLASIVRDNPDSDYTRQALENIAALSGSLKSEAKRKSAEEQASRMFDSAAVLESEGKYQSAIDGYRNVVVNFPESGVVSKAVDKIIHIKDILSGSGIGEFKDSLRESFKSNYSMFVTKYKEGNLFEARNYYFAALKNAFNVYTGNTIDEFVSVEDEYIASLLKNKSGESEKNYDAAIESAKRSVEDRYVLELKQKDEKYLKELDDLKVFYQAELDKKAAETGKTADGEELKAKIAVIEAKNGEIAALINGKADIEKALNDFRAAAGLAAEKSSAEISQLKKEIEELKTHSTETLVTDGADVKKIRDEYAAMLNAKDGELKQAIADAAQRETQNNELISALRKEIEDLKSRSPEKITVTDNNELNRIKAEYAAQLTAKENELKKAIDDAKIKDSQSSVEIADLKKEIEALKAKPASGVPLTDSEMLNRLKDEYEAKLADKEKTLSELTREMNAVNSKDTKEIQKLKDEYMAKDRELTEEKKYIQSLKDQLFNSYKKNEELTHNVEEANKNARAEADKELAMVKERYNEMEKLYQKSALSKENYKKEITEEIKRDYERTLQKEIERLQQEFNNELIKLKNSKRADEVIRQAEAESRPAAEKSQMDYIATKDKLLARIVEIIDDSVTFQFFSESMITRLSVGDVVTVVRLKDGRETEVGKIRITYTSPYSLFGRGRIASSGGISVTDILRK